MPTERKRRRGNPGKRALPEVKATLEPVDGVPSPPASLTKVGVATWYRLWAAASPWLSPATDLDLVIRLCQAHQVRPELQKVISAEGRFSDLGAKAVDQLRQLDRDILQMESRCGFTPVDRVRLGVEIIQRETKLSKLDKLQARDGSR